MWGWLDRLLNGPKPDPATFTRCGTPTLQAGGTIFLHTGNVTEIVRGEKATIPSKVGGGKA